MIVFNVMTVFLERKQILGNQITKVIFTYIHISLIDYNM